MDLLSLDIDHWITIINLEILTTKEICKLTRVCKTLYNIVHNEAIIHYINKINSKIIYFSGQSPNPMCRCYGSYFPRLMNNNMENEMFIHNWFPLIFLLDFYDNYEFMKEMENTYNCKLKISNGMYEIGKTNFFILFFK